MKGLVGVMGVILWSVTLFAGGLAPFVGVGPGGAALGDINQAITLFNHIIADLNDTSKNTSTIDGTVPRLPKLGSGLTYQAGERFWIFNNMSIGGKAEYFRTASSTAGAYTAADGETSSIKLDLDCSFVGFVLSGRFNFLDYGLVLSGHGGIGYYYSGFSTDITFEMPSGYPPISTYPPEGKWHYNNSAVGIEAGISLSYPLTQWFAVGADLTYRALTMPTLTDAHGTGLDLDGDGTPERIDLSGISVQFTVSLAIDLSQKE